MNKLHLAQLICQLAHKGQVDKGGHAYYKHCYNVALLCKTKNEKIVAYLHDVIEDTEVTLQDLEMCGFSKKIITALDCITHVKTMPYCDYLDIVKGNKLARNVKIADLKHNAQITRIVNPTEADFKRCNKYKTFAKYLSSDEKTNKK